MMVRGVKKLSFCGPVDLVLYELKVILHEKNCIDMDTQCFEVNMS